jgi:diguanylate cyclase (GGDEF)-like protein
MTTDYVQHTKAERGLLPRAMRGGSALRHEAGNPQEIMALIARHEVEKDGWQRTMGATVALLRKAQAMIEHAEGLLCARENRIRELEDLSTTDELTGLLNRRGFFEVFIRETGRAARKVNKGGILILVDIDNFHAVNKLYGQEAGDTCLRVIAHALKNEIRPMDAAARLGADEFVVLFSNTDRDHAIERVQHLALRLNNLSFIWHGAEICTSASLGIKHYGEGDRSDEIFRAADRHLQRNKQEKKDKTAT